MKKFFSTLLVITAFVGFASAKIVTPHFEPTKSEKDFDVIYYMPKSLTPYEVPKQVQDYVSVNQAFKATYNGAEGEIRYSLFTDTGSESFSELTMYENIIYKNMVGKGKTKELMPIEYEEYYNFFNGQLLNVLFVENPESKFSSGYKYMRIEFFYKYGQGICVRSFLFNDTKFIGVEDEKPIPDSDFMKNYACFKFMDKDKDGNYIKPNK